MVATPLGPNQAMNAVVARSVPVPARARKTATGRATKSVKTARATAAQPSPKRPCSVSSEPNTTKIPSLTISRMSETRSSKWWRTSGRRIPKAIAHT